MRVTVTSRIKEVGEQYLAEKAEILNSSERDSEEKAEIDDVRSLLQKELEEGFLSTPSYTILARYCQSKQLLPLFQSVESVKLVLKSPQKIVNSEEKSKEERAKEKRREYLKMRQEEREYRSMLDSAIYPKQDESNANIFNSLRFQLTISFNMVSAVFATFGIAYYVSSQLGFISSQSLMIGLGAAITIMVLEMILYITRAVRAEDLTENKKND